MALFKNWPVEKQGGLGSLFPGKGGERIKPRPTTRRPLEPIPFRPTIPAEQEPGRIRDLRPPGVSLRALKAQRQQLREQLRQIEAKIRSLMDMGRPHWEDIGPEPPRPTLPWAPQPIGPPTMPGPGTPPPSMPAPTPVGPPTMPPRPIPPWGG